MESEYIDRSHKVFIALYDEWRMNHRPSFDKFLNDKQLGIRCKRLEDLGKQRYIITDKKKWLLTKLKYGI